MTACKVEQVEVCSTLADLKFALTYIYLFIYIFIVLYLLLCHTRVCLKNHAY